MAVTRSPAGSAQEREIYPSGPESPNPASALRSTPRQRTRLDSMQRVRRELTRIYLDARDGERDVSDASKLGNLLALLGQSLIEGGDLERRLEALERITRR